MFVPLRFCCSTSPTNTIPMRKMTRTLNTKMVAAESAVNIGLVHDGFDKGVAQFRLWHDLISPLFLGLENVPLPGSLGGRPILFIGNHTQFGMYDLPLYMAEMYSRGYQVTGLAHPQHWQTPLGPFFENFGAVKASPLAAYRALSKGQNVLLFPGDTPRIAAPQLHLHEKLTVHLHATQPQVPGEVPHMQLTSSACSPCCLDAQCMKQACKCRWRPRGCQAAW